MKNLIVDLVEYRTHQVLTICKCQCWMHGCRCSICSHCNTRSQTISAAFVHLLLCLLFIKYQHIITITERQYTMAFTFATLDH